MPEAAKVDKPKADEIGMVCKYLKLDYVVESSKTHPADFFNPGRVRVCLFNDDKTPVLEDYPSKKALMLKLGELIPQLQSRVNPPSEKKKSSNKKGPTTSTSTSKKGGKGKKGRR